MPGARCCMREDSLGLKDLAVGVECSSLLSEEELIRRLEVEARGCGWRDVGSPDAATIPVSSASWHPSGNGGQCLSESSSSSLMCRSASTSAMDTGPEVSIPHANAAVKWR